MRLGIKASKKKRRSLLSFNEYYFVKKTVWWMLRKKMLRQRDYVQINIKYFRGIRNLSKNVSVCCFERRSCSARYRVEETCSATSSHAHYHQVSTYQDCRDKVTSPDPSYQPAVRTIKVNIKSLTESSLS